MYLSFLFLHNILLINPNTNDIIAIVTPITNNRGPIIERVSIANNHGFFLARFKYQEIKNTIINYKCSEYYYANNEEAILWNDPELNIDWGIKDPILAEKDRLAKNLATFDNPF